MFEVAGRTSSGQLIHQKLDDPLHSEALNDDYLLNTAFGREATLTALISTVDIQGENRWFQMGRTRLAFRMGCMQDTLSCSYMIYLLPLHCEFANYYYTLGILLVMSSNNSSRPNRNSKFQRSRREILKVGGIGLVAGLAGCSGGGTTSDSNNVTAAFVYDDVAKGVSFINSHERAREEMEEKYEWLETRQSYEVEVEGSEDVFRQYAEDGVDIVFGNTFGYQDVLAQLSQEYTDVRWENCAGFQTTDNLGLFYTNQEEARYVLGKAAAMLMDEGQALGYIGSFPISLTKRNINALTLGARSVDPEAETIPQFVNTWYDPPTEQQAADSLAESGVGSVFQVTDSAAPPQAADEQGIFGTGMWGPMREFGGENYLSGVVCNWAPHYDQKLNDVKNGEWESEFVYGGFEEGMIEFDDFGPKVTDDVKTMIEDTREGIGNGEIDIWEGSKFEGADPREEIYAGTEEYVEGVDA